MKILYHRDFDGAASAAMLMAGLHIMGQGAEFDFASVDYGDAGLGWNQEPFPGALGGYRGEFAVVDFRYHPGASFWFDHHPAPFGDWREVYEETAQHNLWGVRWDPMAPSCANVVWRSLPDDYKPLLVPLREAADKIDQAAYESLDEYFKAERPEIGLNHAFHALDEAERTAVIAKFASADLEGARAVAAEKVAASVAENLHNLDRAGGVLERRGDVVIMDCVTTGVGFCRFAQFYYHPDARYALTIHGRRNTQVSLSKNPWLAFDPETEGVNLGVIASEIGGGGHAYAARASFRANPLPHVAAWAWAAKVAARLNTTGVQQAA